MDATPPRTERLVAVYEDFQRACKARRDLLDAGYRASQLTLMDAPTARLTRSLEAPPIPEAVGGAIIGALLTSMLALHPVLAALLDPFSVTFVPILLVGAALGAIVSYFIADRSRPVIVRRMPVTASTFLSSPSAPSAATASST